VTGLQCSLYFTTLYRWAVLFMDHMISVLKCLMCQWWKAKFRILAFISALA